MRNGSESSGAISLFVWPTAFWPGRPHATAGCHSCIPRQRCPSPPPAQGRRRGAKLVMGSFRFLRRLEPGPAGGTAWLALLLDHQPGVPGPGLAAVDGGLGAPLLRQPPHAPVDIIAEAQQVADDAAVQQGAVGVGVGQVGRPDTDDDQARLCGGYGETPPT